MRFSFLFPRLFFPFIVAIVVIGGDGGGNGGSNDDKGSGGVDDDDDKNGSYGRVFGYVLFSNFVLNPSKLL